MRREHRKNQSSSEKNISMAMIGGIAIVIIAALILAYLVFGSNANTQVAIDNTNTQKIATENQNNMLNIITNSQTVSSSIGKTVNELENNTITNELENTQTSNTNKVAVNTSNQEKIQETTKQEETNKQEEIKKEETVPDPTFIKPVQGETIKNYSKDNLIYSNTLEEWTTHLGIDFKSEKTDVVKAAADGTIKSIKTDPRYGLTVVIEHVNGFESVYSSLLTAEFIQVGEKVKQGQTIATVGNTATFEIADETHIHFEIKKNGDNVDPNIYIKDI